MRGLGLGHPPGRWCEAATRKACPHPDPVDPHPDPALWSRGRWEATTRRASSHPDPKDPHIDPTLIPPYGHVAGGKRPRAEPAGGSSGPKTEAAAVTPTKRVFRTAEGRLYERGLSLVYLECGLSLVELGLLYSSFYELIVKLVVVFQSL